MPFEYREVKQDIFELVESFDKSNPDLVMLVQTISGDCVMGAGIAKKIEERYGFRSSLLMEEGDGRGYLSGSWRFDPGYGCFLNRDGDKMHMIRQIGDLVMADRYYLDQRFGSLWHFLPVAVVTKKKYYEKPTLETMKLGLEGLKQHLDNLFWLNEGSDGWYAGVHLVMPTIGCGLDSLDWADVSRLIHDIFGCYWNTDDTVKITVCIK